MRQLRGTANSFYLAQALWKATLPRRMAFPKDKNRVFRLTRGLARSTSNKRHLLLPNGPRLSNSSCQFGGFLLHSAKSSPYLRRLIPDQNGGALRAACHPKTYPGSPRLVPNSGSPGQRTPRPSHSECPRSDLTPLINVMIRVPLEDVFIF